MLYRLVALTVCSPQDGFYAARGSMIYELYVTLLAVERCMEC